MTIALCSRCGQVCQDRGWGPIEALRGNTGSGITRASPRPDHRLAGVGRCAIDAGVSWINTMTTAGLSAVVMPARRQDEIPIQP